MTKTLLLFLFPLLPFCALAQDSTASVQPNITVKWAPLGLLLGSASVQAEYNFGGNNSLTAKIGFPVKATHNFQYEDETAAFTMKATSFLAGYRTYLSKKHLRGFYYEPFFKYVHHNSEGMGTGTLENRPANFSLTNNYSGFGVGVQLGAQFLIGKRVVVDLFFFGPEINSASNSFKAADVSSSIPWSNVDAARAEEDIRDFLDQLPFISNRTTVTVDREMKQVRANFKGALPGVRTGLSVGFAF